MPRKRSAKEIPAATITGAIVRDQSAVQGLRLTDSRAEELARDLERHLGAIAQASSRLDLNDEPARFARSLQAARSTARRSR